MWLKGYEVHWFRPELPRKEGPALPHRPGFGQTPLKVMQSPKGYYVGTAFILPDGSDKPYTIESDYFSTEPEALSMLQRLTGKNVEERLRKTVRAILREIIG